MDTIYIRTAVSGDTAYRVFKVLRPTRVLIEYEGTLVFADFDGKRWDLFAGSLPVEDEAVLKQALAEYGTLDRTVTTVTKVE